MRSDVPGLEKLPPLPKIETDISKLIDKDRWKDSKMWKIGVSARRKQEYEEKIFKQAEEVEKFAKKRRIKFEFKGVKRKPEYYYNQLEEMVYAAPVSPFYLKKILNRIVKHLRKNCKIFDEKDPLYLKEIEELKVNYEEVMREVRREFILGKKMEIKRLHLNLGLCTMLAESKKERISSARNFLARNLHNVHPLIRETNNICLFHIKGIIIPYETFRSGSFFILGSRKPTRVFSVSVYANEHYPTTETTLLSKTLYRSRVSEPRAIKVYSDEIIAKCVTYEDEMMSFWWPEISLLFSDKKNLAKFKGHQRLSILNCANTLLLIKVNTQCNTGDTVFHFGCLQVEIRLPEHFTFFVRLKVCPMGSHAIILCDPTMKDFQEVFLTLFDHINQVLSKIPTMQCWIEEDDSESKLKVSVTEYWMDELKEELKDYIKQYYEEITELCETCTPKVLPGEKAEVNNLSNKKELPLICIDLSFLKTQLIALHDNLIDQLKTAASGRLSDLKQGILLSLFAQEDLECPLVMFEFSTMKTTLLTDPETAKEMVVLNEYYERLLASEFQDLLDRVKDALSKTIVLMNLTTLGAEELKINSELLMWPKRMKPVFKECYQLLEEAKVRFEEKLAAVIRKEEALAKQAPSAYPEVDAVLNAIGPSYISINCTWIGTKPKKSMALLFIYDKLILLPLAQHH
ncbi:dynein heavy chain 12, axonemal [Caerostris extrusa]|uniref:Dynein heavy chain 12, axonemal n=1 Tax=Caerostris extrusa TaxID=172846 RepID=A0AAV4XIB0_CAEEX|nr:dynein heavy chain 12, axonemal [Caerostris extrusa]